MRDVGRAVDVAPRAARAATVCGARRGDRAVVGPSMTARDAARDAFAAESRESDARGGDSERPGTPGRDDDDARDGIWNTAELHQRLMNLNVHSSTSSTSSRKSSDPSASGDGLQTTTSGSASGAGGVERDADGGVADEVDVENDDEGGEIRCSEF